MSPEAQDAVARLRQAIADQSETWGGHVKGKGQLLRLDPQDVITASDHIAAPTPIVAALRKGAGALIPPAVPRPHRGAVLQQVDDVIHLLDKAEAANQ